MRPLKSLTLEASVDLLATTVNAVDDPRGADQLSYALHDTLQRFSFEREDLPFSQS